MCLEQPVVLWFPPSTLKFHALVCARHLDFSEALKVNLNIDLVVGLANCVRRKGCRTLQSTQHQVFTRFLPKPWDRAGSAA